MKRIVILIPIYFFILGCQSNASTNPSDKDFSYTVDTIPVDTIKNNMNDSLNSDLIRNLLTTAYQEKINVINEKIGTTIEAYKQEIETRKFNTKSANTLREAVKKALLWADKNEHYQKEFTKELCRIDIENYCCDKMVVEFAGDSLGGFELTMHLSGRTTYFIKIIDKKGLKDFDKMLHGISVNEEIDSVFN